MNIFWHGKSCFSIAIKGATGAEEVRIVIDPYHPESALKLPRSLVADVLLSSHDHPSHNYREGVAGDPFVITGPGEYEAGGVFVYGIPTWHDKADGATHGANTMYRIECEGMSLAHLGDLGHVLTDTHLEALKDIDVLFVPVGGGSTIDAVTAADVVNAIEPRVVIPMHYAITGRAPGDVQKFLKAMGANTPEPVEKLKLSKKDLPTDQVQVVVFAHS
ncbi:MBL fold metallo-hydrolase [Candidatus Uhrbacteria bacterium]|nr:MBL fold metallo-hydrolase [Candidatus Uhrbacteria bacterium]